MALGNAAAAAAAAIAVAAGSSGGPWTDAEAIAMADASAAQKPKIAKQLIPYPQRRKSDMAAYSKRHYGH